MLVLVDFFVFEIVVALVLCVATRLIKSGNRFLKYYLCEAAYSLVRCDTEFRRYYDLKHKEVNKYQHKRALALTARKLVRLVFRLLKDNRLYIPAA